MTKNEFLPLLHDYPSLLKGVSQLGASCPTDLQEQFLNNDASIDNLILSAPAESGKLLALILHSLRKLINDEQGILLFISHSKDFSQTITHQVSVLTRIPVLNLYMQQFIPVLPKQIIVGNPSQANSLPPQTKQKITYVLVLECDFLFAFNYGDHLHHLAQSIPHAIYKLSCVERCEEINVFKEQFMSKATKIKYIPPQKQEKLKKQSNISHFYTVGDRIFTAISLYVTLRFHLVSPKILIVCESLKQVYRMNLFLERCKIPRCSVYNHENPVNLKFYTISVWVSGSTHILISTAALFTDLSEDIFKQNNAKSHKRKALELTSMAAIITLNLSHIPQMHHLLSHFSGKPLFMTFLEQKEEQVASLQNLIKLFHSTYQSVSSKQLPVNRKELQAFRYRISDVFMSLGPNRVEKAMELDLKKKLLRSPEMKKHFGIYEEERTALIKKINELRKSIQHNKISIPEIVPEYLVPESLKISYSERIRLERRAEKEEDVPQHHRRVRRVLKYAVEEEQNPETTDVSRLKLISARKRWKLLHGFKLKKRNIKNQKKGIFQTN